MPSPQMLLEKLQALPPERLVEVEDFIDFLNAKSRRLAALDRLLAIAPLLAADDEPPMTEDEIQAEVDVVRATPRGQLAARS